METLSHTCFMTFCHDMPGIVNHHAVGLPLAAREGHIVTSYLDLLKKMAALNYHNLRFSLLLRGQTTDYGLNPSDGGIHSALYPSLLRHGATFSRKQLLDDKFDRLERAEQLLISRLRVRDVYRDRVVRWALLQHYEVCHTPLLDVTRSLQTALSFALAEGRDEGYLFVLAVPLLTGPISISMESLTLVVDLCQACPPEALRPHVQSGLLIGDYPLVTSREASHGKAGMLGNNFACRLLTKFRLINCRAWGAEGFTATPESVLRPDVHDEWNTILKTIGDEIGT